LLREHVRLDPRGEAILTDSYDKGTLSARGRERVLRVARTIADLDASDVVTDSHVRAALALRHDDPIAAVGAA
jgi:magnesium chelatase family protein